MRIVLDSNVVVSALLSPHAPPAQALQLALQGAVLPLYDDRILAEYRDLLSRPRFDFDPEDVRSVLDGIAISGEIVFAAPLDVELPDADDLPFLEVAVSGRAEALVTGNVRHYQPVRGRHDTPILTPRAFLDFLARRGRPERGEGG